MPQNLSEPPNSQIDAIMNSSNPSIPFTIRPALSKAVENAVLGEAHGVLSKRMELVETINYLSIS
ncbi:MAG: hypothetical protein BGO16_07120 [Nitrobacter sp. 62-23]|nr:MAG: hypothetical protein BGO16_07120 [Nitrobacter sp. 62-23]